MVATTKCQEGWLNRGICSLVELVRMTQQVRIVYSPSLQLGIILSHISCSYFCWKSWRNLILLTWFLTGLGFGFAGHLSFPGKTWGDAKKVTWKIFENSHMVGKSTNKNPAALFSWSFLGIGWNWCFSSNTWTFSQGNKARDPAKMTLICSEWTYPFYQLVLYVSHFHSCRLQDVISYITQSPWIFHWLSKYVVCPFSVYSFQPQYFLIELAFCSVADGISCLFVKWYSIPVYVYKCKLLLDVFVWKEATP